MATPCVDKCMVCEGGGLVLGAFGEAPYCWCPAGKALSDSDLDKEEPEEEEEEEEEAYPDEIKPLEPMKARDEVYEEMRAAQAKKCHESACETTEKHIFEGPMVTAEEIRYYQEHPNGVYVGKSMSETALDNIAKLEGLPQPTCMPDPVNNPDHYNDGDIECIDAIQASMSEDAFEGYCKGNAMKYLWRYTYKGKPKEDIKKSLWYLRRLSLSLNGGGMLGEQKMTMSSQEICKHLGVTRE